MLKHILKTEIPTLEKLIERVVALFASDGIITAEEAKELKHLTYVKERLEHQLYLITLKERIATQLQILDSGIEFMDWCDSDEIRRVRDEVKVWEDEAKATNQPKELVDCYSQIVFLLGKSVSFYNDD